MVILFLFGAAICGGSTFATGLDAIKRDRGSILGWAILLVGAATWIAAVAQA